MPPLPWQHTSPPHSLDEVHSVVLPDGQAVPVTHVAVPPPPSTPAKQHLLPVAQSIAAEQTWAVPDAHEVAHVLAAPAAPAQHCWPIMQLALPVHDGGVRHVP
ncbi:MAG: hypothetical protein ACREOE_04370 [Gemmatimonadales bacterium]